MRTGEELDCDASPIAPYGGNVSLRVKSRVKRWTFQASATKPRDIPFFFFLTVTNYITIPIWQI